MTLTPEGGAAIPVSVTTTRRVQGGAAIPVYGYMTAPTDGRPAMGGPAVPVRVLTAADLKENGGMWTLEGRPYAMPVYTAPAGATVMGGPAIAVYPVNAWPTVPVVPVVPFVPTDLAGLQLWLKADAGLFKDAAKAQPCNTDADAVYTWADQSGNGNDAVQADAGKRPTYKVNIQNGLSVVRFDGTDDWIQTPAVNLGTQPSIFVVAKLTRDYADYSRLINGYPDLCIYVGTNASEQIATFYGNGVAWGQSTANSAASWFNTWKLVASINDGNDNQFINGLAIAPRADALAAFNSNVDIGGVFGIARNPAQLWQGDVGELLIYNSALSAANRALVEAYLNGRWAVY